jgi:hypothetical protein
MSASGSVVLAVAAIPAAVLIANVLAALPVSEQRERGRPSSCGASDEHPGRSEATTNDPNPMR